MNNLSTLKKNKKRVTFRKEIKPILKKTTLPFDNKNQIKKSFRKVIKKPKKSKTNIKKYSAYKPKKVKQYRSKKKTNLKKYLVKTKIIDTNTKSPDKLIDDLFQICYNNNINVIKYPRFKYNK